MHIVPPTKFLCNLQDADNLRQATEDYCSLLPAARQSVPNLWKFS